MLPRPLSFLCFIVFSRRFEVRNFPLCSCLLKNHLYSFTMLHSCYSQLVLPPSVVISKPTPVQVKGNSLDPTTTHSIGIDDETDYTSQTANISGTLYPVCVSKGPKCNSELLPSFAAEVSSELNKHLALPWIGVTVQDGINVLLLSRDCELSVQRRAFFSFSGKIEISVHRKVIPESAVLNMLLREMPGEGAENKPEWKVFLQRIITVVQRLKSCEVCVGVDDVKFKPLWDLEKSGEVDRNPYGEKRYKETFRPFTCHILVNASDFLRRRCPTCIQAKIRLSAKLARHNKTDILKPSTPNVYLDRMSLLRKVQIQQKKLKDSQSKIFKLTANLQKATSMKGIAIDDSLSEKLLEICMDYVVSASH